MRRFFSLICIFFISLAFNSKILADELGNLELPTGGEVVSGDISIQKEAGKLIINQNSSKGIIEWQKFNVGADASVYFNHKNNTDSILNQIVGGSKSIILGNIFSNGKLFVNNPNGITVGANASINAHSFIGSAMKIANQDFLNHNYHYKQDRESLIDQNGNIDAQYVALMATDVTNSGTIRSKNGSVNLAASDDMVLKISSDNSLQVKVKPSKLKATVSNKGIVIAENGVVTIKADMAQDAIAATIKAPENQAKGLVSKNGVIKLVSNSGTIKAKKVTLDAGQRGAVENTGKIDTSSATSKGGSVELIGKEVIIKSGSEIKSNGKKQGGNIYVGNPTLLNSVTDNTFVTLENNTVLDVSSLEDSAGVVKIRTGKSSNGSMTSVNGVILARTGSSRRKDLANVAVTGYDVNLNEIYIDVSSTSDSGGSIHIEATNDVVGGKISLISNGKNEGGDINVVSLFGDVNLQQSIVQTNASLGRGGTVNINAKQNIFLIDSNLYARGSPEGGNVTILSSANDVNLKSTLIQTNGSTGRGGTIELSGFNHTIIQSSSFYSKGSNKGGNIYIGNNFYEKTIPFSKYTYIDPYSIIDATSSNFGGFVETSGQILELLSKINVGYEGLWLIDPYDVTIASSGDSGTSYSSSFTPSETTTILASSVISSLNAGTSVSITTGSSTQNTLTVNAAIAKTSGSSATLTLTGGFIDINADISSTSGALNLVLDGSSIDLASALSLNGGNLTVTNASDSYMQSGAIFSGSGSLTKAGVGALYISHSSNSYTGKSYINGGTVSITGETSLGTTPSSLDVDSIEINNGAVLTHTNATNITISANRGILLGSGSQTIRKATRKTWNQYGPISGSGNLILDDSTTAGGDGGGGGRFHFYGANTYTGTTTIKYIGIKDPGLWIHHVNALQYSTLIYDNTYIPNNGESWEMLAFAVDNIVLGGLSGDRSGIYYSAGKTISIGNNDSNTTYSGNLSIGTLNKIGSGTLTLSGSNSFALELTEGELNLGSANAIGSSGNITFSGGRIQHSASNTTDYSSRFSLSDGDNLKIDTNSQNVTWASNITASNLLVTKYGSGDLNINGSYNGNTNADAGNIYISGVLSNSINIILLTSDVTYTSLSGYTTINLDSYTLTINLSSNETYAGTITGSGSIIKTGLGTFTLSGSNSYTGSTTLTQGTISISSSANLGATPGSADVDNIIFNGGTLQTTADFTLATNKGITMTGAGTISTNSSTTLTYAGVATGSGGLTKEGSGTLILSGTNTYTGNTTISTGTLKIGKAGVISDSSNLVVNGTFDMNGFSETIASLSGSGTVTSSRVASVNSDDSGLIVYLDAGSYSGSGNWLDLTDGSPNATLGNSPSFDSDTNSFS